MADNFFSKFTKPKVPDKTWLVRNADTFQEEKIAHKDLMGDRGEIGDSGKDGKDGLDGRGIKSAEVDNTGFLVVTYSDGETLRVAKVSGKDGKDGLDGKDGNDGLPGKDGLPGFPGRDGKDGTSINDAIISTKGELIITFSDGSDKNLGRVIGRDGQSIETRIGGKVIDTAGLGLTGQMFRSIAVASQPTIDAKTYRDTLNIAAGSNVTLTTNKATKTLTIAATGGGGITSVSGTTNRITSTGGGTPVIDISAAYVGQASIITLGTITTGVWNGTAITNGNLANSTISGISLGANLADLTAANATLTFSGAYNGGTARTIGLNLSNANTWAALQTFGNNISYGGAALNVTSLASGNILQYNGTNWVNVAASSIGGVTSVSNSDGTLTISPTTGAVVASLALGHANIWIALQTFQAATSLQAIVAKAAATTPGNIQEWQSSGGTVLTYIKSSGNIRTPYGSASDVAIAGVNDNTGIYFDANYATRISSNGTAVALFANAGSFAGLYLKSDLMFGWGSGAVGADIDTTLFRSSAGVVRISNTNAVTGLGALICGAPTLSTIGLTVKGAASQSADLQEWQNSSGTVLSCFDSIGRLCVGTTTPFNSNAILSVQGTNNVWTNWTKAGTGSGLSYGLLVYGGTTSADKAMEVWSSGGGTSYFQVRGDGLIGINQGTPTAQLHIVSSGAATIGAIVKGAGSQSANLQEWQNSSATILNYIGPNGGTSLSQAAATGTPLSLLLGTSAAHTALTASTERIEVNFNLSATQQFATGALTTQRAMVIQAPTYAFVGASTITNAATMEITSAPVVGTNATITNKYGLRIFTPNALDNGISVSSNGNTGSANLYEGRNSNNAVSFSIDRGGNISIPNGALTCATVLASTAVGGAGTNRVPNAYFSTLSLLAASSSTVPFTIQGTASQSADLQQWQNSSSGILASMSSAGILTVGLASTQTGQIKFNGTTSGTVTLSTADAAGTWTMKLPTTGGTNLYFLQTDGSGNTTWAAGNAGTVTSVSGTTNRITSTGGATPVIDISASYVGQSSIVTTGTLTSGATGSGFTVALGTSTITGALSAANGGTGVANNSASTITISGNFGTTFTVSGTTGVTLPTSGTLTTLATVLSTVNAFSKQQTLTPQALTSTSNSIAWDANNGNNASHTATENTTLANPTNLVNGTCYTFQWTQNASAAKTLAFGNKWKFSGSSTVSATLSSVQIFTGLYDGTNINAIMTGPFS